MDRSTSTATPPRAARLAVGDLAQWDERQVRDSVKKMAETDRLVYFDHLAIAKAELGLAESDRSLAAANLALARTFRNRRVRREKAWLV